MLGRDNLQTPSLRVKRGHVRARSLAGWHGEVTRHDIMHVLSHYGLHHLISYAESSQSFDFRLLRMCFIVSIFDEITS